MTSSLIFTKHALQRLDERSFQKRLVEETLDTPDKVIKGKQAGTLEYQKKYDSFTVTAIVTTSKEGKRLVLSCWRDPPIYGTADYKKKAHYQEYKKAGFWKKWWLTFLHALGL